MKNKAILILVIFSILLNPAGFAAQDLMPVNAAGTAVKPADVSTPASPSSVDPLKEKISVDYKDVDIADILRSLSYTYGLNVVTSTDVKGKVTISLKDVTISDALEAILSSNGYNYSRKGNILYISPGSVEGAQAVTEAINLKYIKAADAQNLVRKVLSPKGDIKVDEVSNMLVITDFPASIEKLKVLLKSVDKPPRQVLIEAKIVDITSKDLQNMGVTWTINYSPSHGIFGRSTDYAESLKATSTMAGPSSDVSGGQFKLDALTLKGLTATAQIDALIQSQKAHLLASPSIAVLNNREARIIIGEKVPYKERTQTTTGTTETTRFIDVGTTLRVTPSINADGYITLAIHPEVSSVTSLLDAGPRITTREADTVVRVKENETIVIGGLIKQEDNRTGNKIPILGDIPLIGNLFSDRSKSQSQTELAVFITPKILLSRGEMQEEKKNRYEEEAYINILSTADLNVQKKLFEKAKVLQTGKGLEAVGKEDWQRKNQAISLYDCILTQFPDGPKAPEAGYEAAILLNDIGEYGLAKQRCETIASKYPNTPFADKAIKLEKSINEHLRRVASAKADVELNHVKELTKEEMAQEAKLRDNETVRVSLLEGWEKQKKEAHDRARLEKERRRQKAAIESAMKKVERKRAAIEDAIKLEEDRRSEEEARSAEQAAEYQQW